MMFVINLFANEDFELISKAYKNGLRPVPSNFESLLHELKLEHNDISRQKVLLGKKLFFEKELSKNADISCASCHSFQKGGVDAIPTAIGHKGLKNPFHLNTPTVLNAAFSKNLFWDGGTKTLKEQAKGPLQAPFEMAITPKLAEERIMNKSPYKQLFKDAFGSDEITFDKIAKAIAIYEKTLVTKGRYDNFLTGDENALNKNEKEGLNLFITKGCVGCHNGIALGGQELRKFPLTYHKIWSLKTPKTIEKLKKQYFAVLSMLEAKDLKTDRQKLEFIKSSMGNEDFKLIDEGFFHRVVKSQKSKIITSTACNTCHISNSVKVKKSIIMKIPFPIENQGGFLGSKDKEKYFRVPLLRNIIQTKPYFHNGSVEKLEEAIKIMGTHQTRSNLNEQEIDKIIAFLKSVDGKMVEYIK
jgi:cytochrome c peroxidase